MTNISHNPHPYHRAIGVFESRLAAEEALQALKKAGFDMENVSIIARNADSIEGVDVREEAIGNKADEGAATGAAAGGALGTIGGLLVGLGTLAIPGVGPILLAGAGATALATTLAGTAIGAAAGSLAGGLIGLGIPEEKAKVYSDRISRGDYLVMVTGSEASIRMAETVLSDRGIQEWNVYDIPTLATPNPVAVEADPMVVVVDRRDETGRTL